MKYSIFTDLRLLLLDIESGFAHSHPDVLHFAEYFVGGLGEAVVRPGLHQLHWHDLAAIELVTKILRRVERRILQLIGIQRVTVECINRAR